MISETVVLLGTFDDFPIYFNFATKVTLSHQTAFTFYSEWLLLLYKHWPDTRQFITRTVELWSVWIKLS